MLGNPDNPILLGKLKKLSSGRCVLIASENRMSYLTEQEYNCLKIMNGYHTWGQIAQDMNCSVQFVQEIFERFIGPKSLTRLGQWNKLHWSDVSQTYYCTLSNIHLDGKDKLVYVPLTPPCDPWICMGAERDFIIEQIQKYLDTPVPDNIFVLANNSLYDGKFFWQVIVAGQVIMLIHFDDLEPNTWRTECLPAFRKIDWAKIGEIPFDDAIQKTVQANASLLEALVQDTLVFIEEMVSRWDSMPLVYFSGGKESMVMFDLFRQLDLETNLVFGGVGFDFPLDVEWINYLQTEASKWNKFHLYVIPGDEKKAWDALAQYGPITLTNTWCRAVLKYPNRDSIIRKLYPDQSFIAFEGSRWYENDFRRTHERVMRMRIPGYSHPHHWALPLAAWTGLEIWSYILGHNLPINPLYYEGFQRTTCWICPLVNPFHLHRSQVLHPDLWQRVKQTSGDIFVGENIYEQPF